VSGIALWPARPIAQTDAIVIGVQLDQSVSLTFDEPGTYAYIYAPHPWMMAQLIVQ
jgi:plastocyanin